METLVAILMLSIAMAGPLTIAQKGLQTALISKDQVSAYYLAQDAVEFIRFARDTNCLAAGGSSGCPRAQWLLGSGASQINLSNCVSTTGTAACTVDTIAGTAPASCPSGVCPVINYDSNSGRNLFTYSTGSGIAASIFTRTVTIKNDPAGTSPDEAAITVKVQWSDPVSHTVTVTENIFNWQ